MKELSILQHQKVTELSNNKVFVCFRLGLDIFATFRYFVKLLDIINMSLLK